MSQVLTSGAVQSIMTGEIVDKPVLQVLGQKKIAGNSVQGQQQERYRLLLSDGVHSHSSVMLATQQNHLIHDNKLEANTIIRLDKYICNQIQPDRGFHMPSSARCYPCKPPLESMSTETSSAEINSIKHWTIPAPCSINHIIPRPVVILIDVTILSPGSEVGGKLGNPAPFKKAAGGENQQQQQQQPAAPAQPAQRPQAQQSNTVSKGPAVGNQSNSFYKNSGATPYGNKNPPTTPKAVAGGSRLPNTPGGGQMPKIVPISNLNPYQNRWTIRARVTNKSNMRTWSNSRGEGKLFSMNLVDESGEIKATAFKEQADKYFDMVEVNKIYYITKGTLKTANKQYSSVDNDYEMTFNHDTMMEQCEDEVDLPTLSFNFVPISQLNDHAPNSMIDVIGVVKHAGDLGTVTGRQSQKEIKKRDLQMVDQSNTMVNLTLWGADAENFEGSGNPVIAVKGARLSDFGGRSLSVAGSSQMVVNPDVSEAHTLRGWYDSEGANMEFNSYRNEGGQGAGAGGATNWKTFGQIKGENVGQDKPEYYTAKGTVVFLRKENCMYMACPTENCNKKLVDQGNGMYRCEKCQKEFPNYKWRMILSANLADFTDNQWVTCFQETAETLLGRPADEIGTLKEQDEAAFEQLFTEANFKEYIFKLRAKMETYNDESRLKTVCVSANPVDHREYNQRLISEIKQMAGLA